MNPKDEVIIFFNAGTILVAFYPKSAAYPYSKLLKEVDSLTLEVWITSVFSNETNTV